jgi:hypothetical protein
VAIRNPITSEATVGAVYDRALFLESTKSRGLRPRLQSNQLRAPNDVGRHLAFEFLDFDDFGNNVFSRIGSLIRHLSFSFVGERFELRNAITEMVLVQRNRFEGGDAGEGRRERTEHAVVNSGHAIEKGLKHVVS